MVVDDGPKRIKMFGRTYSGTNNLKQYRDFIEYNEDMGGKKVQEIKDFALNTNFYESTRNVDLDSRIKGAKIVDMRKISDLRTITNKKNKFEYM